MARRIITDDEFLEVVPTASPVRSAAVYDASAYSRVRGIVNVVCGLLETILLLRFAFLLFGANQFNGFVSFIYALSLPFVVPFYGIFREPTIGHATLDSATIVAMVVYAIIAWIIIRIAAVANNRPVDTV